MRVVYVDRHGDVGALDEPRLDATSERHIVAIPPPTVATGNPISALERDSAAGLVVEAGTGCPNHQQLKWLRRALRLRRRGWIFWPEEGAVECVTPERLASYQRHWLAINFYRRLAEPVIRAVSVPRRLSYALRHMPPRDLPGWVVRRIGRMMSRSAVDAAASASTNAEPVLSPAGTASRGGVQPPMIRHAKRVGALREARHAAKAIPFPPFDRLPDPQHRIRGCGVYLRTDFWAPLVSGGSYGHTCYVAKELAAVTESFVCFLANRLPLLDDYGVRQIVMPPPSTACNEEDIVSAVPHYLSLLRPAFSDLRPAYIYERLALGNSAGSLLSAEFGIPYIVEYNGSEISMKRSFEGTGYVYEAEYLESEALAFEQATLISVVSAEVRTDLVARGVDPAKILVNPNGVDLEAYAPPQSAERESIRRSLGFDAADRVIGFTGTFGGWHGIDVLSEAIPRICRKAPRARFLLIGDGSFKHLVDGAVASSGLQQRVVSTGRVPQAEGARLLKACDIYVSPHSTHMIDSKFFGSPTKVFEYMALGGGIVASDLEQIGQVLSPALSPDDASRGPEVSNERAVLCTPGDVSQFVQGVVALTEQPDLARALGRNARQAALDHYSWKRHVGKLWIFVTGGAIASELSPDLRRKPKGTAEHVDDGMAVAAAARPSGRLMRPPHLAASGDAYKDQVHRQWDHDPAGSHYVTVAASHTKEWFLEAERYRYETYAPWMRQTMEFDRHQGAKLLEIGGGMGTDLAQFAAHGARVTDADLSTGHLRLARENFAVRGLSGEFLQQDAESLVFDDNTFDVVYSNGVLHHTPDTRQAVREIFRVLKPGGRVIAMVYAEDSLHYWRNLMWNIGLREGQLRKYSMGEIMSRAVERSDNAAAHPLVKAYTKAGLRRLFDGFIDIEVLQRQLDAAAVPRVLARVPRRYLERIMGWNLIIKARKPDQ
jgi:glycosyltransferase involved in cell wall biosynthesis/ubiquinone/menaquinone biosynthesis C-methylase UbiE